MKKVTETVRELALPVVEGQGCKLWDVEYVREAGQWYLRIYIDKDGGVNILDCEAISRALSDILDEADPIESSYIFEVASAGAERPLKRHSDFEQFMGSPVLLKTYKPIDGRKEFSGDLAGFDNGAVTLRIGEEEKRFVAMHHPFTMPNPEDLQYLESDPARVRALAYDVVLNGIELGSGSIRIHDSEIQSRMFRALGFSPDEIEKRFGFMVHAFSYGTPPHGGFAFGLDRLVMQMLDLPSLRDVVAFPKVRDASCPMTEAPTPVDDEQLKALGLLDKAVSPAADREAADISATYAPWKGGKPVRKQQDIDIDLVARLSRLDIPAADRASMIDDMRAIVDFAGELSELDTTGVPVMAHAVALDSVMRDDVAYKYPSARDMIERSAPEQYEGMPVVPRTFA